MDPESIQQTKYSALEYINKTVVQLGSEKEEVNEIPKKRRNLDFGKAEDQRKEWNEAKPQQVAAFEKTFLPNSDSLSSNSEPSQKRQKTEITVQKIGEIQ